MNGEIKIQQECLEFINLQVCGKCHDEERKRLTLANLNSDAKSLLKHIQSFLYFGEPITYTPEQFEAVKKVLSKLKIKVTPPEMNLINYLSLIVQKKCNKELFSALEKTYNRMILSYVQTA